MSPEQTDLNPVEHVTMDAIGKPGERVFYIQGWRAGDPQPLTIIIEKVHVQSLALGVQQMLADLEKKKPELATLPMQYDPEKMKIHPPLDPLFRAGEMGLGYDSDNDRVVIVVKKAVMDGKTGEGVDEVRFWCSRQQAWQLVDWGMQVVARGRPLCPQCGEPMEPEGHFCPKKNGHKH